MATLKKYDLRGLAKGDVSIDDSLLSTSTNLQMIKDCLVAMAANKRQWNASTQTRAEVNKTKRKPFAQKGTGNARQGFLGSPQYKGGGRVHAPRPKSDQHIRINKKERRAALRHLLAEKIIEAHAHILSYETLDAPKTKTFADFLHKIQLSGKRILFIGEVGDGKGNYGVLQKSIRNIPKVNFAYMPNVSCEDLARNQEVIILEAALGELTQALGGTDA